LIQSRVLLIYIEPTPYVLDLIDAIEKIWQGQVDVLFLETNTSQSWNLSINAENVSVLSKSGNKEIKQKITDGNYQMIHLAGWGHKYLMYAMVYAWWLRIPISIESDTPLPVGLSFSKRLLKRIILPWVFKLPSVFLPGGKRQAEFFRYYGVKESKITLAQMTVDISKIQRYQRALSENGRNDAKLQLLGQSDAFCFLYVGRMEPHKSIQQLITSFKQILTKFPQAKLLLVGDGSLNKEVQSEAAKERNICYAGRLSGDQLLNAYCIANVFVLPSIFEPWGLVINEAMAAGLPVIASNRAGCIDDLVEHEETGLIIDPENPEELKTQMEAIVGNEEKVRDMGQASLEKIAMWTKTNEANNIVNAWLRVLD